MNSFVCSFRSQEGITLLHQSGVVVYRALLTCLHIVVDGSLRSGCDCLLLTSSMFLTSDWVPGQMSTIIPVFSSLIISVFTLFLCHYYSTSRKPNSTTIFTAKSSYACSKFTFLRTFRFPLKLFLSSPPSKSVNFLLLILFLIEL